MCIRLSKRAAAALAGASLIAMLLGGAVASGDALARGSTCPRSECPSLALRRPPGITLSHAAPVSGLVVLPPIKYP